jgi:translation initiation factor IF-1
VSEKGVVEEVLPNALYRVRLESGRVISAGISTEFRHQVVRLIVGAQVFVEVAAYDPNRGKIIKRQ